MKRQDGTKNKKWLIPTICLVALLAVLGTLAAVFLPMINAEPAAATGYDGKLYWNVEREIYKTGKYFHRDMGDDLYRLLFAVDGEQVQLDVKGMELVTYIDTMDLVALEFDENGIVVGAKHPESAGLKVTQYYVENINADQITINSNYAFRGLQRTVTISEDTAVYDIKDTGPLCGLACQVNRFDEIQLVEDEDYNVVAIFNKPYKKPGDIYWNVDKLYDSVTKRSTRQPNQLMQYDIDFIVNGELVTLRCKDPAVVDKIDAVRITGLVFDENNYIVDVQTIKQSSNGGRTAATNYYVTSLNFRGGQYRVRNKSLVANSTTESNFFPAEDMIVYDMTGNNGPKGQITDIRVNDRVIFILDCQNRISIAFVTSRVEDTQLYWNVDRKWNKTTLTTNRVPDQNGWYYFKMAVNGKHITVKTDDLAIANAIEKPVCVGLKLNGDVVEQVKNATAVHPGGVFASWLYIKEIGSDGTIVAERTTNGETKTDTAKLAPNCQIYNTSATAVMEGETISTSGLKVGDTIHGYKDFNGDISVLYLVSSTLDGPLYWNVDKNTYWNASKKESTRTPDENGYYNILFAVNGSQVTLRTRSKSMVDDIDNRTCMALRVSSDVILKVFGAVNTTDTKGGLFASSYHVTAINGGTITATKLSGTDAGKTESRTMAWNCKVYNVSNTATVVGEKSAVQVGDQIRCLLNADKQISVLYILTASNHKENHKCDCCGQTPMWLAWDGNTTITKSGHYVLNADITALKGIEWNKDLNITLCLNGHEFTVNNRRVLGNVTGTMNIVDCVGSGSMHGTANNNASITMVDGGVLNIYGGTYTAEEVTEEKNGGLFTIIGGGQINMYGGTISGGKTNGYGGNVNISDGIFTMHGGTVQNGTSAEGQYGGNFALSGAKAQLIVNGGQILGGNSGSYGGNIAVAKTGAKLIVTGGKIENGTAATHGGNICVALGSVEITGGEILGGSATTFGSSVSLVNDIVATIADVSISAGQVYARNSGGLTLGGKVSISDLHLLGIKLLMSEDQPLQNANIAIGMETPGIFMDAVKTDISEFFTSTDSTYDVVLESEQLKLVSNIKHSHCDCGGVMEHTCDETIEWTALTVDTVLEDGGHYYLIEDLNRQIKVPENATIYLCLNGHALTSGGRLFDTISAGKTLNVYDCGLSGTAHSRNDNNAPVALVNGGTLNIYGGSYSANAITAENKNGGVLMAMNDGVINFYNGTITGGNATGMGGCVYITNDAQFNMYGGSVTNGISAKDGGTIAIAGNAKFTMLGGCVTGGTASGKGNCVFSGSTASVVLGGSVAIEDVYLDTVGITLSDTVALDTAEGTKASVGITKTSAGEVVTGITQEQAGCFTNNGKGALELSGDKLILDFPHAHCVCVGAQVKPAEHVCTEAQVWLPITASKTISDSGYYFLDWSAGKAAAITVADGVHAHLCLNGATIYAMNTITLGEGSTLDICDCSEDKTGKVGMSGNASRGPVVLDGNKTINLYSGTLIGQMNSNTKQCVVMSHADARFNMYGGTITKGISASYGGNVAVQKGVFTMYAGIISEGQATTHGGNVTASGGKFIMKGGQVSDGTATTYGGNISFVTANSSGLLTGGSITGGTAGTYAACVYVNNNNVTVGGSVIIEEMMIAGGGKTVKVSTEEAFVEGANIGLALQNAPTKYTTVISSFSDLSWFDCTMDGYTLDVNEGNIVMKPE